MNVHRMRQLWPWLRILFIGGNLVILGLIISSFVARLQPSLPITMPFADRVQAMHSIMHLPNDALFLSAVIRPQDDAGTPLFSESYEFLLPNRQECIRVTYISNDPPIQRSIWRGACDAALQSRIVANDLAQYPLMLNQAQLSLQDLFQRYPPSEQNLVLYVFDITQAFHAPPHGTARWRIDTQPSVVIDAATGELIRN